MLAGKYKGIYRRDDGTEVWVDGTPTRFLGAGRELRDPHTLGGHPQNAIRAKKKCWRLARAFDAAGVVKQMTPEQVQPLPEIRSPGAPPPLLSLSRALACVHATRRHAALFFCSLFAMGMVCVFSPSLPGRGVSLPSSPWGGERKHVPKPC